MAAAQDKELMTEAQATGGRPPESAPSAPRGPGESDLLMKELFRRLDAISARLAALANDDSGRGSGADWLDQLHALTEGQARLESGLAELENRIVACATNPSARDPQPESPAHSQGDPAVSQYPMEAEWKSPKEDESGGSPEWQTVLFGDDLAGDRSLKGELAALVRGLWDRNPAALALIGHLLVFHAAPDGQRPQLLKDVGEAYYRWRPKPPYETCPLEPALAASLERLCEAGNIRRKIDLVELGSRFNAAYHRASEKGVEIAGVDGWLILREDGSVYQKASVVVR